MPSTQYSVVEPHPSVPRGRTTYLQSGRGGAGNIKRYNSSELTAGQTASGPASRVKNLSPPPSSARFTVGRGGAGNTFSRGKSERAIFSFDEELRREETLRENLAKAPVYHIGRGGAGNLVDEMRPGSGNARKGSTAGSVSSAGSSASERARRSFGDLVDRIHRTVSKQ